MGQQIRLYYHQDLRGTVDYLTSPVSQKIESWTHYNEWGEITHNAVLKCGQRELDLVKNYTGHDYDAVLNLYYAKARMYDAENRRFTSLDPIMDGSVYDISEQVTDPMMFAQYLYVKDNPLRWVDPLGLYFIYKYTDDQGKQYFKLTPQHKADAIISNIISAMGDNWQTVFESGTLVGGTSVLNSTPSYSDELQAVYGAEFERAKEAIRQLGPEANIAVTIVDGITIPVHLIKAVYFDIPASMKVVERDKILIQVMDDAVVNHTKNYYADFPDKVYMLDKYIQDFSPLFISRDDFGGLSYYDIGKEVYKQNTESTTYQKAYAGFKYLREQQIWAAITDVYGIPQAWGPKLLFPSWYTDYGAEVKRLAEEAAKADMEVLGEAYKITIDYFRQIVCTGGKQ